MILSMAQGGSALAQEDLVPVNPAIVSIIPADSSVYQGEEFTVTVWISDAVDLGGYEFMLDFDPEVVTPTVITDAGFIGADPQILGPHIYPGTVWFGAVMIPPPEQGANGNGALAVITLKATKAGTSTLDLYDVILTNTDLLTETPTMNDGTVEVLSPPGYRIFLPFVAKDYP